MYCLTNLLFFDIPLLYYYINLRSSILGCLFSGDIFFLGISLSSPLFSVLLSTVSEVIRGEVLENFSANLLSIKLLVGSAVF